MKNQNNLKELNSKTNLFESNEYKLEILKNAIEKNDSFLKLLLDTIPSPVFYKDKEGIYQHCNDAFSQTILGIPKEKIIGKSLYDLPDVIPTKLADIYYQKDLELFQTAKTQFYEAKVRCSDGIERYYNFYKASFVQNKEIIGLVGVMLDVSDYKKIQLELEEKNKKLKELSTTDDLTGLNNRRHFEKIFEKKIYSFNRYNRRFALTIIDIDFFKDYNDAYGHTKGDEALILVAKTLKENLKRPNDYIFRIGGEEFAILFDIEDNQNSTTLINNLIKNIESQKINTHNNSVSRYLTISAGLGLIINESKNQDFKRYLYNEVDNLLYKSKKKGRNRLSYKIF